MEFRVHIEIIMYFCLKIFFLGDNRNFYSNVNNHYNIPKDMLKRVWWTLLDALGKTNCIQSQLLR